MRQAGVLADQRLNALLNEGALKREQIPRRLGAQQALAGGGRLLERGLGIGGDLTAQIFGSLDENGTRLRDRLGVGPPERGEILVAFPGLGGDVVQGFWAQTLEISGT